MADPQAAPKAPSTALQKIGERGAALETFDDLWRMATLMVKSGMIPSSIDTPEKAAIAIQMGLEAGISPMTAVRGVMVIDGKPSWTGQMALALLARSGLAEHMPTQRFLGTRDTKKQGLEQFADDYTCEVTLQRKGQEPQTFLYSVADAKLQKLWGKKTRSNNDTPWSTDPTSMMWWRALGRGMRRVFPDVLNNLPIYEEARDYLEDEAVGRARDVTPARPKPALEAGTAARDPLLEHFEGAGSPAEKKVSPETEKFSARALAQSREAAAAAGQREAAQGQAALFDPKAAGVELDPNGPEAEPEPEHEHTWTWELRPGRDDEKPVEVLVCACGAVKDDDGPFD